MNKPSLIKRFLSKLQNNIKPDSEELGDEQENMIRGVVELSETTVKEVMVPRIDTIFINSDAGKEEVLSIITNSGHSRFPVYKETIDNVIGILYAKDALNILVSGKEFNAGKMARKAFFVPDSKRIDTLLKEFKRRHVHIAVAVDEYGGVSGIVCMEDIIEEIVGDIQDEFDDEQEDIVKLSDSAWLCDARVDIEDLNDALGLNLPDDDFDTLGGYLFDLFGKIPVRYEKMSVGRIDFIIQEVDGHKIDSVKIIINAVDGEKN